MTADLVILVPVLRRPQRVEPLLASIAAATPAAHRVLFLCTPDDVDEIEAVEAAGAEHLETDVAYRKGDYARKINLGYRSSVEPLMFLAADDLHFHPEWFERAAGRLEAGIGVVGTNDLGNPRTAEGHSTHSLVTRAYADDRGTIDQAAAVLHEGYRHNFVDDELVATAKQRHAYAHARDSHVEHLHPHWRKAELDATYEHGLRSFEVDRRHFAQRAPLWH